MRIDVNDYLVVIGERNKRYLTQVLDNSRGELKIVVDNGERFQPETQTEMIVQPSQVVANLGSDPPTGLGNVYGVDVEPWIESVNVRHFGPVQICRDLNTVERKRVLDAIARQGKIFYQRGWLPAKTVSVEIRPPKGKWDGVYFWSSNEEKPDRLVLRCKSFDDGLDGLVAHELFHGYWFNGMDAGKKSAWIELFHRYTTLTDVTPTQLTGMRQDLIKCKQLRDFMAGLDVEEKIVVKEIFVFLKKKHKADARSLDTLVQARDHEEISRIWPVHPLKIYDKKTEGFVSDYAKTKVEEFFAESAMHWHIDQREGLSPAVLKLINSTVASVGSNR